MSNRSHTKLINFLAVFGVCKIFVRCFNAHHKEKLRNTSKWYHVYTSFINNVDIKNLPDSVVHDETHK